MCNDKTRNGLVIGICVFAQVFIWFGAHALKINSDLYVSAYKRMSFATRSGLTQTGSGRWETFNSAPISFKINNVS